MHNFKKYYGQNFLKSTSEAEKIVKGLDLISTDTILEIGPGHGALTDIYYGKVREVILVEIDSELIPQLEKKYKKAKVINADILNIEMNSLGLKDMSYKVISSLPYNVSKPIIKKFLISEVRPTVMSLLMQKEVAEDYTAVAPKSTFLGNFASIYSVTEYIGTIKKEEFHPTPKVDGGIVRFRINPGSSPGEELRMKESDALAKFIKVGFTSPRKTLSNNLSSVYDKTKVSDAISKLEMKEKIRPAEVEFENWISLFDSFTNHNP